MTLRTLQPNERPDHRWFSCFMRADRASVPTLWIFVSMPWRRWIYDPARDEMRRQHPVYGLGFKFARGGRP